MKLTGMKITSATRITIALISAFFIIFSVLAVLKHQAFNSTAFDLGIFDQNVWMFSKGQNFVNSINGFYPFADHIQPVLYLIAVLYKFVATPVLLLLLQVAAVSAGAIPLFLLARKKLGEGVAVAFVVAYFLYPPTQYFTLFDFHTEAFLVPFLLFALYFLTTKSTRPMFVFLFLAGLTKEYIPVIFIFFAAYMLIVQKRAKPALAAAVIGGLWLFVNYGIILGSYQYNSLHVYLGAYGGEAAATGQSFLGRLIAAAAGLVSIGKLGYVFLMLLPLAGLPLLGIEFLALSIPGFALVLLRSTTTYKSIITHHTAFIMPFLFAAAVPGFRRALSVIGGKRKRLLASALIVLSVASFAAYGPFTVLYDAQTFNARGSHAEAGRELLAKIPKDPNVAVSATTWAVPHLSERSRIYMFPAPFKFHGQLPAGQVAGWFDAVPYYVVLDTSRKDIMIDSEIIMSEACNVAKSGNYTMTYDQDGWVLLERSDSGQDPVPRLCVRKL